MRDAHVSQERVIAGEGGLEAQPAEAGSVGRRPPRSRQRLADDGFSAGVDVSITPRSSRAQIIEVERSLGLDDGQLEAVQCRLPPATGRGDGDGQAYLVA